ncbi:MAG: hypothetical protein IJG38_09610 [Thermoguttaceae bacterium]|nr:hypothetical protein [Thermoguttaceae bacterium]
MKLSSEIMNKPTNNYYRKKGVRLLLGDCMEVLQQLPENSVDMIFADPPYLLSNGGITCYAGQVVCVNKGEWDQSHGALNDFLFHYGWINACRRVLKPEGTIWISGTYHSIFQCGFALQRLDYKILNDIIWYKSYAPPNMCKRFFTASHETLIWARKDKKAKHTFNYDLMCKGNWGQDILKVPQKQMRSVWSIGPLTKEDKKFGKHPTQKPIELLKRIILASTNEGDLILDPFTGSSTTGVMALRLKREFIGIDTEQEYLDLSVKRLEDVLRSKNEIFDNF